VVTPHRVEGRYDIAQFAPEHKREVRSVVRREGVAYARDLTARVIGGRRDRRDHPEARFAREQVPGSASLAL
jgi:hypothetical protein